MEMGVSIFLVKGEAFTTTSPMFISASSSGISRLTWLLFVTITALEIKVLKPTEDTRNSANPGFKPVNEKFPSKSVTAPIDVPNI